jgi:16S rRNA processing protein RimM
MRDRDPARKESHGAVFSGAALRDAPLVAVGRVGRPHGLDGAFVVERGSDDPRRYAIGAHLYVDGERAEIVLSRRVGGGRRAIKLDRPVTRGQELTVRRDELAQPDPGSFYVCDLVGLPAVDERGNDLGRVKDVLPGVANDNVELETGELVPMIDDAVLEVDLDARRVILNSTFLDRQLP